MRVNPLRCVLVATLLVGMLGQAKAKSLGEPTVEPWSENAWTKVVQDPLYTHSGQHVLSAMASLVTGDDLSWLIGVGGKYGYFITESWTIEVSGLYLFHPARSLASALGGDLNIHYPDRQRMEWEVAVLGGWHPIRGKMTLMDSSLGYFDIGIVAGIGIIGTVEELRRDNWASRKRLGPLGLIGLDVMIQLAAPVDLRASWLVHLFAFRGDNVEAPMEVSLGFTFFLGPGAKASEAGTVGKCLLNPITDQGQSSCQE